ncbi:MAG: glutamate racemase [Clostridia bacterium]|nr:glutamate racemase [Clostridia bacterium]
MKKDNIILFFDSGIGGLTTLYECHKLLPNENYVYYADYENMPYGAKDPKTLKKLIIDKLNKLIDIYLPAIVVIACNTATALVIAHMRNLHPTILFVGTEPALVPAIRKYNHVLLLATQNTIRHSRILKLVSSYFDVLSYCPQDLALKVETQYPYLQEIKHSLKTQLMPFVGRCDCVVLGCTHYVFCKNMIKEIFGLPTYDGNQGVAKRLKDLLDLFFLHSTDGGIRFANKGAIYTKLINTYILMKERN